MKHLHSNHGQRLSALVFALVGAISSTPLWAAEPGTDEQQEEFELSGSVAIGAEYNSNLSVSQLESPSGQSDVAGTLDASLNAGWHPNERFNAEGGYSFTTSRYQDIDAYDLDMHLLFGDVSYDFGPLTLGSNAYYADADLGGDSFLQLNQYSLYAGKLFGQNWYTRAAYNSSDKEFDLFNGRDADNSGVSAELYRFFNDGRSNVMLSYAREDEDTRDTQFRYSADTLRLRFNHRFTLAAYDMRLQLGYRHQDRDYGYITPSIGVPRDDSQRVADARLEVTVVENLTAILRAEQGNYASRLPSADYNDKRLAVQMQLAF